jgi:hypothetical protein
VNNKQKEKQDMNELFNVKQVSEILGIKYKIVWYAARVGDIPCYQAGHSRLFSSEQIEAAKKHFAKRGK